MSNIFIRALTGLVLGIITSLSDSLAQSNDELSSWQFLEQITIPDEVATDPNTQIMFADNLLLVTGPGLQSEDCGRVLVFEVDSRGSYRVAQQLDATDFNQSCDDLDGFGFSMDFDEGNLFIGSPGAVFTASNNLLPTGEVFVYSLDGDRFSPQQRINGIDAGGNRAWGTQVEADGGRLLVQGNSFNTPLIVQGFAYPRIVNLLVQAENNEWQLERVFSGGSSTLYGQDFDLNESAIFISRHDFIDILTLGFIFERPRYDSTLEIYSIDDNNEGAVSTMPVQLIVNERELYNSQQAIAGVNYVAAQNDSFQLYRSPTPPVLINETRFTSYTGFILQDGIWVERRAFRVASSAFGEFRHEIGNFVDFAPDKTHQLSTGFKGQLALLTLDPPTNSNRLRQREQFINANRLSTAENQQVLVNGERLLIINRLVNAEDQNTLIEISVFNAVPALDPAITQAWWFGPDFDGQGVTFEVLSNNRLLMHWFTYDLSGNQMWVRGVGQLNDGEVVIELGRAMGPSFTFGEFDSNDRVVEQWGQAIIRFNGCTSGTLSYQSVEFGNGDLPIMPLVNNRLDCGRGTIFARFSGAFIGSPGIAGSFFDPNRGGEGIILMPIPGIRQTIPGTGGISRAVNRVVGLWLTYTPTGEQAWYYLGVYEQCRNVSFDCALLATQTPRSTTGPVFGSAYDPNDRISIPWGTADMFIIEPVPGLDPIQLLVDNPDGTGNLLLQQSTQPVGYSRLTR